MVTTKLVTAEELFQMGEDAPYELIRGELREVAPAAAKHGRITFQFGRHLGNHVYARDVGVVYAAETGFFIEVDPDTVLAPDVSFIRTDRLPTDEEEERFPPVVPDFVVEVLSPSNRRAEIEEKIELDLGTGVRMLVLIQPRNRTLIVHRPDRAPKTLTEADMFDGEDVIPEFRLAIAELFRSPRRSKNV